MQAFVPLNWGPGSWPSAASFPIPPPPPPPPRREQQQPGHKRALSGASSVGQFASDIMAQDLSEAGRSGVDQGEASTSQPCAGCRELRVLVAALEQKVVNEMARIQQEAQREQEQLLAEVNKKWKGLEATSWKHVGELKDQNRHLRQRNFELEAQNGHLNRHVMLLQEQLAAFKDQQAQFQSVLKATQDRAALLSATLADAKMTKVPHTGADIW